MLERVRTAYGDALVWLTRRAFRRRVRSLGHVQPQTARRWSRQAEELSRLGQSIRLTAPSAEAVFGADLPGDAELLHRPSLVATRQATADMVAPDSGYALSADVTLHHDFDAAHLSTRQVQGGSGQALIMDLWHVEGSFVSLALALPETRVGTVGRNDLIRLGYDLSIEQNCDVFARLNLGHGPNTEQVVRQLDLRPGVTALEFDVHYTDYDPDRAREIWIDLIFAPRPMNRIEIRDLTIARRPRLSL
ncbi:DUF6478 family protein [Roseobacter sp. HKCCA0434]|uniref:DUF6478 family protein n=1 Tax=Roseobacter sp. HKCCA0434 TaxID=3079297 RepID=UPI002905C459|nr:DUF6478 family protein [Roseobacter sp. HKCCA0434]